VYGEYHWRLRAQSTVDFVMLKANAKSLKTGLP
jgi:hypothetical protein